MHVPTWRDRLSSLVLHASTLCPLSPDVHNHPIDPPAPQGEQHREPETVKVIEDSGPQVQSEGWRLNKDSRPLETREVAALCPFHSGANLAPRG